MTKCINKQHWAGILFVFINYVF